MNDELLATLLSWAAMLSGYSMPDHPITVEYMDHSFFVDIVCGGQECDIVGSFLDEDDPYTIYLDKKFEGRNNMAVNSFVVHEAIHAAQWHSGEFETTNCDDSLKRERQAYYLQNEFLVQNGHAPLIHMSQGVCMKGAE